MVFDLYAKLTFLALITMMVLPIVLVLRLGPMRFAHLAKLKETGETDIIPRFRVNDSGWPDQILQIQNAYKNQFELPVLFYALTILTLTLGLADKVFVVLGFLFVLSRYAHAAVHTTTNNIPHRLNLFSASLVIVIMQLLYLGYKVLGA